MRLVGILLVMALHVGLLSAQNPVQWSFGANKISDTEYELIATAQISKGWYLYSQYMESDEGPIPTSFIFEPHDHYELVDETKEDGYRKEAFDDIFGMTLVKYSNKVKFTQRILVKGALEAISGSLDFMTCDDERCLPPTTVKFDISLK